MPYCTKCGRELQLGEICDCISKTKAEKSVGAAAEIKPPVPNSNVKVKEGILKPDEIKKEDAPNSAEEKKEGEPNPAEEIREEEPNPAEEKKEELSDVSMPQGARDKAAQAALAAQNVAQGALAGAENIKRFSANAGDQFVSMGRKTVPIVRELLKRPADKISKYVINANRKPMAFILISAVLVTLLTRFFYIAQVHFALSFGRVLLNFFEGLLFLVVEVFIIAGCEMLAGKAGDEKVSLRQGLAVASLFVMMNTIGVFIYSIAAVFEVALFTIIGNAVARFFEIVGIIFVMYGIKTFCKDENKLPYIMGVLLAVLLMVEGILRILL